MAKPWSMKFGDIRLNAGGPAAEERPAEGAPFRMLLMGNFSGSTEARTPLSARRLIAVDRDNFDGVLARLDVEARLPAGQGLAAPVTIRFRELDDFHPDRLFERVEVFEALRSLRRRLENSKTFAAAAAEVRGWAAETAPAQPPESTAAPPPSDPAALLEQMLGGGSPATERPAPAAAASDWGAFLKQVVAPHLAPGVAADQDELIARVDEATGAQMRALLHHPAFRALEAAWRAVFLLVRRLDTDEGLKLYLLDVTREDLAADLGAAQDLHASAAYNLLVEQAVGAPGGQPWAVLTGDYTFGPTPEDALLLARLGLITQAAGAPFLAGADSRLFGCPSLAERPEPRDWDAVNDEAKEVWEALRTTPQAAYLGLAAPRFLLRLPYGAGASSTEQFEFEEVPDGTSHEAYLWGNPAFACALLLGQAFNRAGWALRPGMVVEVENLPAHVYQEDGEGRLKPCAEVVLGERAVERMLAAGVMPLLSLPGSDKARLARFQSLATPSAPLTGRWH